MGIIPFERLAEQHYLKEDIVQSQIAIYIAMFFCGIFSIGDYLHFGFSVDYYMTTAFRMVFFLLSLVVLHAFKQTNDTTRHNQLMLLWGILFVALSLYVNIHRPITSLNFTYIDITIVLGFYLIMPNRLSQKVILASLLTLGDMSIISFLKEPLHSVSLLTIFTTYVIANLLGFFFSKHVYQFRLTHYRALLQEQNSRVELEKVAYLDSLTGTYTRRKFFELGEFEFGRFKRYMSPFSILMLDLDHFKQLNDKYGHEAGDLYLTEFANGIVIHKRTGDSLGRLGGEEFALILPETNLELAQQAANRILSLCAAMKIPYYSQFLYTTVSIGISEAIPEDQTFADTLRRADDALYKAKEQGRNRIVQG